MSKSRLTRIMRELETLKKYAEFQRVNFANISTGDKFVYPTCEPEVTPFITERTRIYRDCWLVGTIEVIMSDVKAELEKYNRAKKSI